MPAPSLAPGQPPTPAEPTVELWLFGEVGFEITAPDVVAQLRAAAGQPVLVNLDSPGGDAFTGLSVYELLRQHPGRVEVRITGLAASAASVIAMAGDTVAIAGSAHIMIHDGATGTWGDQAAHLASADLLGRVSDTIASIYASRAGGTTEAWRDIMRGERWYSASEAVAAGLADEVLDSGAAVAAHLAGRITAALTSSRRPAKRVAAATGSGSIGQALAIMREDLRRARPSHALGGVPLTRAGDPVRLRAGRRPPPSVAATLQAMRTAQR